MTNIKIATTAALAATLGVATACWIVLVSQMSGMQMMGVADSPGSFASFMSMWMVMITAMMLPSIIPVVLKFVNAGNRAIGMLQFAGAYLAVWAIVGIPAYALHQPHGSLLIGIITIATGIYELTPFKKFCRRRCCQKMHSGFECGLYCVGSCIGLMLVQVALGAMSITWMAIIALIVFAQKLLPSKAAIDIPLALIIIGLGILILIALSVDPY